LLPPLYITLYTWRGPIAIAGVKVMPRGRLMYSNANTLPLPYANNNTRLTHLSGQK